MFDWFIDFNDFTNRLGLFYSLILSDWSMNSRTTIPQSIALTITPRGYPPISIVSFDNGQASSLTSSTNSFIPNFMSWGKSLMNI